MAVKWLRLLGESRPDLAARAVELNTQDEFVMYSKDSDSRKEKKRKKSRKEKSSSSDQEHSAGDSGGMSTVKKRRYLSDSD
jgi:hypothetical protein